MVMKGIIFLGSSELSTVKELLSVASTHGPHMWTHSPVRVVKTDAYASVLISSGLKPSFDYVKWVLPLSGKLSKFGDAKRIGVFEGPIHSVQLRFFSGWILWFMVDIKL